MKAAFVLDTWGAVAYLRSERAADEVARLLEDAARSACDLYMTTVNWGELAYLLVRDVGLDRAEVALAAVDQLPITLVEVDRAVAGRAALLKARHGMGYADAITAALALLLSAPLVTGDPDFRLLEPELKVRWLKHEPANATTRGVPEQVLASLNPGVHSFVPGILEASGHYAVSRVSLFGSSTQTESTVVPRDLDVAVRFDAADPRPPSDLYSGLASELERLTGLSVDLVEIDAVRNPYLREQIDNTEVVLGENP